MISSAELCDRHGLSAVGLLRWERQGWLSSTRRAGSGSRVIWPDWCDRMVAILAAEQRGKGDITTGRVELLRRIAAGLEAAPDARWLVDADPVAVAAASAAEAVELALGHPGPSRWIISPPPVGEG